MANVTKKVNCYSIIEIKTLDTSCANDIVLGKVVDTTFQIKNLLNNNFMEIKKVDELDKKLIAEMICNFIK